MIVHYFYQHDIFVVIYLDDALPKMKVVFILALKWDIISQLNYYQPDRRNLLQWNFIWNLKTYINKIYFKLCPQNDSRLVQASICEEKSSLMSN